MKIVFVTPSLKTGGGNRVFIELANIICKKRQVIIISPNNSSEKNNFELDGDIMVQSIGVTAKSKLTKFINLLMTIRYVNKHNSKDIIIISDPLLALFMVCIKSKLLYRYIQSDDYRIFDDGFILGKGFLLRIYKLLCLKSYRYKKVKYLFNSQYVYRKFCIDSQQSNVPCWIVHPALNHDIFNKGNRVYSNRGISICLVARKHPLKGTINFLNVLRTLETRYRSKISRVIMISHDDLSTFNTEGIEIIKPKSDKEIAATYQCADVFISTSWCEGFGLPPLEAMACGCAVICSDAGGVNEYALWGKNSLRFEPRDERGLKYALIRLIEDENLRNKLSIMGLDTAR